jgi:hypothetical protein
MDGAPPAAPPGLYGPVDSVRDGDDLHWMRDVPRLGRRGAGGGTPWTVRLDGVVEPRERASGVVWTAVAATATTARR